MSITDELREYVIRVHRNGWLDKRVRDDLLEIADRIDAAVGGMVELPVDADGVPIHVGDVVEYDGVSEKVTTLSLWSGGWNLDTEYGDFDGRRVKGCELELLDHPELFRHVQPDSQERIFEDGLRLVADNVARKTEMVCGEVLKQDAFGALMDAYGFGRARGYDEGFGAHLADLEARVSTIERKLNHKGSV